MNKTLLVTGAVAAAGLALFAGKTAYAASRVMVYVAKIGFRLDSLTPYIDVDLMVQNPTGTAYTINALVGQLYYNGSNLGSASNFSAASVAAYKETKVTLPVRVSLVGAAGTLFNVLQSGAKLSGSIRVTGTATINGIPLPYDVTQSVV